MATLTLLAAAALATLSPLRAQEAAVHHHHTDAPAAPIPANSRFKVSVPDVEVMTQNGAKQRFPLLLTGKAVVINFIFTTCTTICPLMGANFAKLEKQLGEHAGHEVTLLSISVDPVTDTPARLKAWKQRFSTGSDWVLVTGAKPDIDRLLRAFGAYTPDKGDHAPLVVVGTPASGEWTRANALASPEQIAALALHMAGGGGQP